MDVEHVQYPNRFGHPLEDCFHIGASRLSFAVGDGVTRDSYDAADWRNGSGAAKAASLFCHAFVNVTDDYRSCDDGSLIRRALDTANQVIGELNELPRSRKLRDPVDNDLFGAVGVGAYICHAGHIHYGYVGDSALIVFDSDLTPTFRTKDQLRPLRRYFGQPSARATPDIRRLVRSKIRNNSEFRDDHNHAVGYGVLTGELGVRDFFSVGQQSFPPGGLLVMISDGFLPFLELDEFAELLSRFRREGRFPTEQLSALCDSLSTSDVRRYGDDKTLIVARHRSEVDR